MKITLRKDFKVNDKPWTLCIPYEEWDCFGTAYHYYFDFEQALPWLSLAVAERRVRDILKQK